MNYTRSVWQQEYAFLKTATVFGSFIHILTSPSKFKRVHALLHIHSPNIVSHLSLQHWSCRKGDCIGCWIFLDEMAAGRSEQPGRRFSIPPPLSYSPLSQAQRSLHPRKQLLPLRPNLTHGVEKRRSCGGGKARQGWKNCFTASLLFQFKGRTPEHGRGVHCV